MHMCVLTYHAQTVSTRPLLGGELGTRLMCVLTNQGSSVIRINSLEVLQQRSNSFIIVDNCQVMERFLQSAQEGRQYMMCGCRTQSVKRRTHHKFSRHSGSKLVAHERHHHILRDFRNVYIALRKMQSSQSVSLLVTQSIDQPTNQPTNQPITWATVLHVPSSPQLVWTAPGPVHQWKAPVQVGEWTKRTTPLRYS